MRTLIGCLVMGACWLVAAPSFARDNSVLFQSSTLRSALSQSLKDPQSAKFSNLASHVDASGGLVMCGQVSEKGSRAVYGPFRRFAIFSADGALRMTVAGRAKGADQRVDALCAGRPGVN